MGLVPLPTLPAEVLLTIAHETLAAADSATNARVRLGLVSREWRDSLRGALLCSCITHSVEN